MNILRGERGSGKTYQLIKMADNYNGHIVVDKIITAEKILGMATSIGYNINMPITYAQLRNGINGKVIKGNLYIDNFDLYLLDTNRTDGKIHTLTTSCNIDGITRKKEPTIDELKDDLKFELERRFMAVDKKTKLISIKGFDGTMSVINIYDVKSVLQVDNNISNVLVDFNGEIRMTQVGTDTANFIVKKMKHCGMCL